MLVMLDLYLTGEIKSELLHVVLRFKHLIQTSM